MSEHAFRKNGRGSASRKKYLLRHAERRKKGWFQWLRQTAIDEGGASYGRTAGRFVPGGLPLYIWEAPIPEAIRADMEGRLVAK